MKKMLTLIAMGVVMALCSVSKYIHVHAEESVSTKSWSVHSVSENPKLEITVRGYPNAVQFGDSVYLICTFKNVGKLPIEGVIMNYQYFFDDYRSRYFRCDLVTSQGVFYEFFPEDMGARRSMDRGPTPSAPLLPGESRVMYVHAFEFPPLEDIRHVFWEKLLGELEADGIKCTMCFTTKRLYVDPRLSHTCPTVMERILYHDILIKPRLKKEMDLLNQWLDKSKQEHLPVVGLTNNTPSFKYPFSNNQFSANDGNKIIVGGEGHNPWLFIRIGNRKPPAHLCPATWQGWKELEESITPSTMRDEIRLTRILIQYCDTEDAKVLTELKEWFAGMNEVQRTVMAKNVCDLAWGAHGTKLYEPYKKIYTTVKEYDIAPKPDHLKKSLEDAGF